MNNNEPLSPASWGQTAMAQNPIYGGDPLSILNAMFAQFSRNNKGGPPQFQTAGAGAPDRARLVSDVNGLMARGMPAQNSWQQYLGLPQFGVNSVGRQFLQAAGWNPQWGQPKAPNAPQQNMAMPNFRSPGNTDWMQSLGGNIPWNNIFGGNAPAPRTFPALRQNNSPLNMIR